MNPLLFYVSSSKLLSSYEEIKRKLAGNDSIIFDAMVVITQGRPNQFESPSKTSEYAKKYREIEGLFKYRTLLAGTEILVSLLDEVCSNIVAKGGVPGLPVDDLLRLTTFAMDKEAKVCLTRDSYWVAEWGIRIPLGGPEEKSPIVLPIYKHGWGEIVPFYVVQYISSAIYSYNQRMHVASLALLSIAVEATLRDLLATKNYTFKRGASPVDIYDYAKVLISVDGNMYTVAFPSAMPKSPADFHTSTGGVMPLEAKIRRELNHDTGFDLLIRTDPVLLDHWSPDKIVQKAQKVVSGLGEALRIARDDEKLISTTDLPPDIDDVLKVVRNNLIHLSSEALDTLLPQYAQYSTTGRFTLRDFINDPEMVYDLVANIPTFIHEQYVSMRTPKLSTP